MTPLMFLKFGEEVHVDALLKRGEIYMQPIINFKKHDVNKERFDRFEGNISNLYMKDGILQLKPTNSPDWTNFRFAEANYTSHVDDKSILSYSLFSINKEDFIDNKITSIDGKMKALGTHVLLIRDTGQFIKKIEQYFLDNSMEYRFGYINYYDIKTNNDSLSLLHKPIELSHQKEFRILTKNPLCAPIKFSIGNLEDFADILNTIDIDKYSIKLLGG